MAFTPLYDLVRGSERLDHLESEQSDIHILREPTDQVNYGDDGKRFDDVHSSFLFQLLGLGGFVCGAGCTGTGLTCVLKGRSLC